MVEKCARFLREERIDIAALVEIDAGSSRTKGVNQVELLSRLAGFEHSVFFPALRVGSRINQGNALLSRYPIVGSENIGLPGMGEPRVLSEACVDMGGEDITLLLTHLSLQQNLRGSQLKKIIEIVNGCTKPLILAGDFNVNHEDELAILNEGGLNHAISLPTYPSWRPRRNLDHVFVSDLCIGDAYAYTKELFSDHLPIVADM